MHYRITPENPTSLKASQFRWYLALKKAYRFTIAVAVLVVEDDFATRWAKVARHRWNGGVFALVDAGQVARVVH